MPPVIELQEASVQFTLVGGLQPLMMVPVSVNGQGPFQFILDTGAGPCLVTPEVAAATGIVASSTEQGTGVGGNVSIGFGNAASLALGTATVRNLAMGITDELHKIAAVVGAGIDGDLGHAFLGDFLLTIDYRRSMLSLTNAEGRPDMAAATTRMKFQLASLGKPLIMLPVLINGRGPFQFALDTGASSTTISTPVAESIGLEQKAIPDPIGAGGRFKAAAARLTSVQVGEACARNVKVAVTAALGPLGAAIGRQLDGIVGYNILKNYRVFIDYPNQELMLE